MRLLHMLVTLACLILMAVAARADSSEKPYDSTVALDSVLAAGPSLKDKVVYVDFWASWCAPCRASFPWMNRLSKRYEAKGLYIVTVNLDRSRDAALKFLDEMDNDLRVVFDSTGNLARTWEVDAMPTSFLYDRKGALRYRHRGFSPTDTLSINQSMIDLLNEKPE